MAKNPFHSAGTNDHGSPPELVEPARETLGGFELDPCSNAYWNRYVIKAARFHSKNGHRKPWCRGGRVFVNSPGPIREMRDGSMVTVTPSLVRPFWQRTARLGIDHAAGIWIGYSLQQLQQLQQEDVHPLCFVTCFPDHRIEYLQFVDGGPPRPSGSPMHGSSVTLVSRNTKLIDRFARCFAHLGAIVEPRRAA